VLTRSARMPISSPLSRRLRVASLAAAAVGIAALTLTSVTAASAGGSQTVFVNEGFTGSSVTNYIKPVAPAGTNVACLTASPVMSQTPIPGCSSTAIDTVGAGALRLTSAGNTLEGGIGATGSVPISEGLDASFDSYQYGGTGADGIVFYLAVTDPFNPQVPTAIGQAGGSLGYSATGASAGLAHGYLGLGLDVYGNYLNSGFDGSGCSSAPGSTTQATNVTVRGPGNGSVGYCVLPGYNDTLGGTPAVRDALHGTTRANSDVPVEVIINPSTSSTLSAGTTKLTSITVAATSYAIVFKTIGASSQTVVTGTLPDLNNAVYNNLVDRSWFDPTTGLPYKLTYGWVASTGGSTDVHEVNYLNAQTVNGPVPVLSATSSVSVATPQHGSSATYTVTPSVASTGGPENSPVEVTTTFPSGITAAAYTDSGYNCSVSGQAETCSYTRATAAGDSLPALNLPFTATGNASSTVLSLSSVVASTDASAVSTSSSATIAKIPTATTLAVMPTPPSYGASETFTATVSPSASSGTVEFHDLTTGATLCAAAMVTNGLATCTTTAAGPTGSHDITADFSGDTNYASSSSTLSPSTQSSVLTITAADSPSEVPYGTTSTLSVSGIPSDATGAVTFTDTPGSSLCTAVLPDTSCVSPTSLKGGIHTVTAHYGGDADYQVATAPTVTLTVDPQLLNISATGTATARTSGFGTRLSFTGLPTDATGTISFSLNGKVLCTATLPKTSCTATGLAAGAHEILVSYSGDAAYAPSSTTVTVTVPVTPGLAFTGSALVIPVAIGTATVLLAVGILLMLAVRRRRRIATS
jgi:Bacterial Ig-like domain (group 3)